MNYYYNIGHRWLKMVFPTYESYFFILNDSRLNRDTILCDGIIISLSIIQRNNYLKNIVF